MSITIRFDKDAPTASAEIMIKNPLPDYDLEDVEAPIPREVDPMLASQGFKDLLDEVRSILQSELADNSLEIVQLTGAICHDASVYRPGVWLVLREGGSQNHMSEAGRERITAIAEKLREDLGLS
jgi:hypothetical protein